MSISEELSENELKAVSFNRIEFFQAIEAGLPFQYQRQICHHGFL